MQTFRMFLNRTGDAPYTPRYWVNTTPPTTFNFGSGSSGSGTQSGSAGPGYTSITYTQYYSPSSGFFKLTSTSANEILQGLIGQYSITPGQAAGFQYSGPVVGSRNIIYLQGITTNTTVSYNQNFSSSNTLIEQTPPTNAGGTAFVVLVSSRASTISVSGGEGSCVANTDQDVVTIDSDNRMDWNWRLVEKNVLGDTTFGIFTYYREAAVGSSAPINIALSSAADTIVQVYAFTTPEFAFGTYESKPCIDPPVWITGDTGWVKVNDGFAPDNDCYLDNVSVGLNALDGVPAVYDPQGAYNRDFNGTAYSTSINSMIPANAVITNIEVRATLRRGNSNVFSRARLGASTGSSGSYSNITVPGASYSEYTASGLFGIDRAAIASGNLGVYFEYRMASNRLAKLDIDFAEIKVEYRYQEE